MLKISASLIVKNEESCLATCLESIRGVDELIVVDTGSTDRTKEIAASFGAKLFDFPWIDDFAAARNESLKHCTGDWVLSIDADSTLEPGGMEKIRKAVAAAGNKRAIGVRILHPKSGNHHWFPHLFKRCPEIKWAGAIHNYLTNAANSERSDITFLAGYSKAHQGDPNRSLRILTKEVEKNPKATREVYYLAREYFYRKDYETAARWWEDYLTRGTYGPEIADTYLMLSRCYWKLGRKDEARDACLRAIKTNNDFKEALLWMADMSGPKNAPRWRAFAALAKNEGILFVRHVAPETVSVAAPAAPPAAPAVAETDAEKAGVFYPHRAEHVVGRFRCGRGNEFGRGMHIDCTGDVLIGDHCMFLRNLKIHTHLHKFMYGNVPDVTKERGVIPTPIIIGSNVVIAEGAQIMAGVNIIGDNAIIGAYSVLTHPVGPNEIWAGNPARLIGRRDDASRQLESQKIPKIIHQIWIGPEPRLQEMMDSWKNMHPGWEYRLWTEKEIDALGLVNRRVYDIYYDSGHFSGASDVVRHELLDRFGGVYMDADSLCKTTLEGAPFMEWDFFTVEAGMRTPTQRKLAPGIIGAVPGHPFSKEMIKRLGELTEFFPEWKHSGPVLWEQVVGDSPQVLPAYTFLPVHHNGRKNPIRGTVYAEHAWYTTHKETV